MVYSAEMPNAQENNESKKMPILSSEKISCALCYGAHATKECSRIADVLVGDNFLHVKNNVKLMGIEKIRNDGMQKILENTSNDPEKQNEIIKALSEYYHLGEYVSGKDSYGKEIVSFDGAEMIGKNMAGNEEKIKIDKKPIGYDDDFKRYVFRYHMIKDDGSIDSVVRKNSLAGLSDIRENIEGKLKEIRKNLNEII